MGGDTRRSGKISLIVLRNTGPSLQGLPIHKKGNTKRGKLVVDAIILKLSTKDKAWVLHLSFQASHANNLP